MNIGKVATINKILMIISMIFVFHGIVKHVTFDWIVGITLFTICLVDCKLRQFSNSMNDNFKFGLRELVLSVTYIIVGYCLYYII